MPLDESVLVIPTTHFEAFGAFQGFISATDREFRALLDPSKFEYRLRRDVETDDRFKQLIPYVVFGCAGRYFGYQRGSQGTEQRLRAQWSLGLGGHISEDDRTNADPYTAGLERELGEEVSTSLVVSRRLMGFINDDRTFVGKVHLGVVHLFELESASVEPKEDGIEALGFRTAAEWRADREQMETWSRFVLDALSELPTDV